MPWTRFLDAQLRPITPLNIVVSLIWTLIALLLVWILGLDKLVVYSLLFGCCFGAQLLVSAGITPNQTPKAFAVSFGLLMVVMTAIWMWVYLGAVSPSGISP